MQEIRNPWMSRAAAVAVLGVLAACAAPTVINTQWVDPTFSAKPVRAILVVGITRDATNRRIYEDAMVAQLGTRGVKAAPSYRFGSEVGPLSQEAMQLAVKEAGATGVLLTRVVNVAQSVQVTPGAFVGPAPGFGFGGFYGFYGGMWASSFQTPPTITVQDNVAADTRLFEVKNFTVVWSASTTTTTAAGSGSSAALLQQFATLLADALGKDGMI
jgi:hypothetical protein